MQQFCVKIDDERGQIIVFKENMQTVKIVWNLTQNCENPKIISKKKKPVFTPRIAAETLSTKNKTNKTKKKNEIRFCTSRVFIIIIHHRHTRTITSTQQHNNNAASTTLIHPHLFD
jgi:hypothetical protein